MQSTESEEWNQLVNRLSERFSDGDPLELDGILFLIGVQELGQGPRRFKKDEKMALMHIAICRLLEPLGHYEFQGFDQDGWPHYKMVESLPPCLRLQPCDMRLCPRLHYRLLTLCPAAY